MENLSKKISIIACFLTMGFTAHSQNFYNEIATPLTTFQITNVKEFKSMLSSSYINESYIPNLRYIVGYKSLFIGIEHYYFNKTIPSPPPYNTGLIDELNIDSYSIFFGFSKKLNQNFCFKICSGMSFLQSYISRYIDFWPQWFEGQICTEKNKNRFLVMSSFDHKLSKHFNIGLNLRFSPMLKPFDKKDSDYVCTYPHDHDRINFFNVQLMLGYRFGANRK